jgi:UMF1 family MFS transporter
MAIAEGIADAADRTYRKIIQSWCLYDWANSAFATTIMAAILPIFYDRVCGGDFGKWGATNAISMLLIALSAPVLGAIADCTGARKRFLGAFAGLGVLFVALMVFLQSGQWLLASILYIVGRYGFASANIFYDSLLPHCARPEDIDQVSARGYAMGYLGGGLLLAVNVVMIVTIGEVLGARLSFLSVAVWWALFTLPLLLHVPEPAAVVTRAEVANPVRAGFRRLRGTFREIRRYRQLFRFLIALWFYNDGIGTIIVMAAIFAKDVLREAGGNVDAHIIGAILFIQFVGIPFAILFGRLARHLGAKRSILLGLGIYGLICISGYFMSKVWHFWALGFAVATAQGGTQALTRSLFGAMSPRSKASEFFGFYNVSAKFAGILGPAICFVVYKLAGGSAQRAILSLIVFFVLGAVLLMRVDDKEGVRVAREADEALHAKMK